MRVDKLGEALVPLKLEETGIIIRALAKVAKSAGIPNGDAVEMLREYRAEIGAILQGVGTPEICARLNRWWRDNRRVFAQLGMGQLASQSQASKLSDTVRAQLLVLSFVSLELAGVQKECDRLAAEEKSNPPSGLRWIFAVVAGLFRGARKKKVPIGA